MPKFSIITPQYNSFGLMDKYFDSMEKQTFKDFEIIIVDDCSTDNSFQKLKDKSSNTDMNIILKQTLKNSGPGTARNIGIKAASGEWITFVDNDDWVEHDFLERISRVIEKSATGCVIYDYYSCRNERSSIARSMYSEAGGIKSVSECVVSVRNHTFGKFYKLSDCVNIRFPETLKRCEDVAYVAQAIAACDGAYYLREPLYYYYQRPNSLSNNKSLDERDMIRAFHVLEDTLGDKYSSELKEKSVCDLLYGVTLMMCKSGKPNSEIRQYIKSYEETHPEWWKCKILKQIGLFKRLFLSLAYIRCVNGMKTLSAIHTRMIK